MLFKKTYFAILVFFVMGSSITFGQQMVSDSIMENFALVVMNDSNQIAAYGNLKGELPHGEWVYFNRRGGKMSEGKFKNGKKHGTWKFYDVFGDLLTTGKYKKGLLHGEWTFHYIPGTCQKKYKDNFEIASTCLYE